jgi:hypothetical protein
MQRNHDNSKKDCVTTSGFKSRQCDDRSRANGNETTAPRGALAGVPGTEEYVRNDTYHNERHQCNDERIPSAGWRDVYQAMGVDSNA